MVKQLNVMHVVLSLKCGGLEKLVIGLSAVFAKNGYRTSIFCLDKLGELASEAKTKGIIVHHVKRRKGIDLTLPFRLAQLIRAERVDIVHTHNMGPLLYGTIAAKFAGVPVVINTRHGRDLRHTNRLIWGMNDAIVAISNDAKNELLKNNAIDLGKVSVIHNGIDLEVFKSRISQQEAKKTLGLDSLSVIGTVSRLSREKDQSNLIKAFTTVASAEPKARLVFAGDGPLKDELAALADDLGIKNKVAFLGFRDDVNKIMQAFDIFVLSSLQEGISLSLLEAMASARPMIVTNVGGNPEVVVDGKTGFLVPPKDSQKLADAIIRLLKNPGLAQKMGEAARARVEERFTLDRMVTEYEGLYKRCLEKKRIKNG